MPILRSTTETFDWGRKLAAQLRAGDVIALRGDLGAGKTHAAKGIVAGLGSKADVTSPTFTLLHEYRDGALSVFHFDFYRIESEAEIIALGWDEILDERGIIIVEWPDRFPALLPKTTRWFSMSTVSETEREITEEAR